MRKAAILVLALLSAACHRSGTWIDDPKNVERAWGIELPPDVTIRHSWYWRSAHFTREEAYFFEIGWNEELFHGFTRENGMAPLPSRSDISDYTCFDRPAWFAPGDPAGYEVWVGSERTGGVLLRSRRSMDLFIAACQL